MAREAQPSEPRSSRKILPNTVASRAPSLRTAVIVFIAVLILFRWLHLVLALDITSTGRQIQSRTDELHRHQRVISDIQLRIATAGNPGRLAELAKQMGYGPKQAVYLQVDGPLSPLTNSDGSNEDSATEQDSQLEPETGLLSNWGAVMGAWDDTGPAP